MRGPDWGGEERGQLAAVGLETNCVHRYHHHRGSRCPAAAVRPWAVFAEPVRSRVMGIWNQARGGKVRQQSSSSRCSGSSFVDGLVGCARGYRRAGGLAFFEGVAQ